MADIYDINKQIELLSSKVRELQQAQGDVGYRQELAAIAAGLTTAINATATALAAVPTNTHKAKGNP